MSPSLLGPFPNQHPTPTPSPAPDVFQPLVPDPPAATASTSLSADLLPEGHADPGHVCH